MLKPDKTKFALNRGLIRVNVSSRHPAGRGGGSLGRTALGRLERRCYVLTILDRSRFRSSALMAIRIRDRRSPMLRFSAAF